MPVYKCDLCFKDFDRKCNYIDHMTKRKKPCVANIPEIKTSINNAPNKCDDNKDKDDKEDEDTKEDKDNGNDIANKEKEIKCVDCNKFFTRNSSLKRHLDGRCIHKKIKDISNPLIAQLFTEIDNLKKHIFKEQKIKEQNIQITNNNVNNVIEKLTKQNEANAKQIEELEKLVIVKKRPATGYKKEKIPATIRYAIWNKYFNNVSNGLCTCCNTIPIYLANFDCGHIVSEKNGGKITLDNLKPICRTCNTSMGITNMNDFMNKYGFVNATQK